MVDPIYIVAILLGAAFLLPLFERSARSAAAWISLLALGAALFIGGQWFYALVTRGIETSQVFTAGFEPPWAINLRMGIEEAALISAVNFLALLGGIYLIRHLSETGVRAFVLLLLLVLGLDGIIMTRDLFNMFVFIEIAAIATYALIGMDLRLESLTAGFKYAVASGIASVFLLLGVIFLYSSSGTLNIDGMIGHQALSSAAPVVTIALFMLLFSFFIEMKQFPANGWALDVYQAAHPGISAMISAGSSGAMLFAVYKILPIAGSSWYQAASLAGLVTFFTSNLMGLRQQSVTRMLGYSSVGQMGLLLGVVGIGYMIDPGWMDFRIVAAALFFNHFFAKAGLYWLAGMVRRDSITEWSSIARRPVVIFLLGVFIFALLGLPPFAGFWGKWSLVMTLAGQKMFVWMAFLLAGSLLEAVYLLRWFGYAVRGTDEQRDCAETGNTETGSASVPTGAGALDGMTGERWIPLWIFALCTFIAGFVLSRGMMPGTGRLLSGEMLEGSTLFFLPLLAAGLLFVLDALPAKVKGALALVMIAAASWSLLPGLSGLTFYFTGLFLVGGFILTIATMNRSGRSTGFYPLLILMIGSLANLAIAGTMLQFFFTWELMTLSSYLLVLRGRKAGGPALSYMIFSLGGAFLILAGFAIAYTASWGEPGLGALGKAAPYSTIVFSLIAAGFLAKTAAIGLHIWAPDAYTESEDDTTPLLSGILSKAGILGLLILLVRMGEIRLGAVSLALAIGWAGAVTAFLGALYAAFQEDAKRLLAWSSIGQVGYIILGLAAMSHLGWAAALWHSVNHLLFKGLLFLAIAGVIYRTGTRTMYEMGGLIKKMPLSFVSVMIGIIALSGVPPLTGFGGKWLLYHALIEKGWYLQMAIAFFSSTIAFLYCYRLIHVIFLGQPKPRFAGVREAPLWLIAPQYILIMLIMLLSFMPKILIQPVSAFIGSIFPATIQWEGSKAVTSFGYWNATILMMIVMAVFVTAGIVLFIRIHRPQKVKQFNIVYAAERPDSPETTHYGYRFFTPYERSLGFLLKPLVKRFWGGVAEWTETLAGAMRQLYTGNAQTYALWIFVFGILLYFYASGVGR